MTQASKAKTSKAKTTPQPLPPTGGSYVLEKGKLTQIASTKPATPKDLKVAVAAAADPKKEA
jgi:hypothetical protein